MGRVDSALFSHRIFGDISNSSQISTASLTKTFKHCVSYSTMPSICSSSSSIPRSRLSIWHPITRTAFIVKIAQRRGDIVRIGDQFREAVEPYDFLDFIQSKNKERNPVSISVPILPALEESIEPPETG